MVDRLDALEGLELLIGAGVLVAERVGLAELAVDDLDGLEQPAGGLAFPDLAETADAQPLDEAVAGDGLGVGFDADSHTTIPRRSADGPLGREVFQLTTNVAQGRAGRKPVRDFSGVFSVSGREFLSDHNCRRPRESLYGHGLRPVPEATLGRAAGGRAQNDRGTVLAYRPAWPH